ncbi:hypothetical protein FACS189487_10040 [Campylobacterota bacterium]|nr:hypothetical protein FACS189487_10040 [Campylobacterota bacterium]
MDSKNYGELIARIGAWHESDEHQNIIDAIEQIPSEERDYEISSLYARALNNINKYEDALSVLLGIEAHGKTDGKWYFRVGYALYYLDREEDAEYYFQKAIEFGDTDEDTKAMLEASRKEAAIKKEQAKYDPELYTIEEIDCVKKHINRYFGENKNVFHEMVSPDIHVDICKIDPSAERDYYILVTMGMGAHRMNIPDELDDDLDRAELMICLPPDWDFDFEDEKNYWPVRLLKSLARMPGEEGSWLGLGHTVSYGEAFAENTEFMSAILTAPASFGKESFACEMGDKSVVNFYQVIPLYEEELQIKIGAGAEFLMSLLDTEALEYVKLDRENVCKE